MDPFTMMALASTGMSILGGRKEAKAKKKEAKALKAQGIENQRGAYFEAKQMEIAAGQQQAIAQRAAQEELRKAELLQSRAIAVAAASGAGASDPTIMKIIGDIAAEGQLAAETQKYTGDEAARAMRVGAKVRRWEGDQARKGFNIQSAAVRDQVSAIKTRTILDIASTGASWYERMPKDSSGKILW